MNYHSPDAESDNDNLDDEAEEYVDIEQKSVPKDANEEDLKTFLLKWAIEHNIRHAAHSLLGKLSKDP